VKTQDLKFNYPEELIATSPQKVSRVMWVDLANRRPPEETTVAQLTSRMTANDVFVINETRVLRARVTAQSGLEILFVKNLGEGRWEVLCPARRWSSRGETLPCGTSIQLEQGGLPQIVKTSANLDFQYFEKYGDLPLPPYIQQKRGERKSRDRDRQDYQTAWAKVAGSLAAPTASFHFKSADIDRIKARGIDVLPLCLHVGLGTFLPVHSEELNDHKMHSELVSIPRETCAQILRAQQNGGRVWALGTTVVRALESWGQGLLPENEKGFYGETDIFIKPGFQFKMVDVLMTNFHQPESTLLALVAAFSDLPTVLSCYQWAIEREFRLFSYGDLSVWTKK
jgi:S-adenosylmethionine:tRNA ribosyltransferase-isomerase